jgi:hypothetical protein
MLASFYGKRASFYRKIASFDVKLTFPILDNAFA